MLNMSDKFHQFMNNISFSFPEFVLEPLSSPQPEFHEGETTFSSCLGLDRLLITGREDEVLKSKEKLSPSLLSHNCSFEDEYSLPIEKVSIDQFSPYDHNFPR